MVIEEIRKSCKKQPLDCGFNPRDNAYEPLKLMQTVMAKTNEICLRYLDNSMLSSLPAPGPPYNITSDYAMKNSRRKMEDRHVIINDLNTMFSNIQEDSPSSYYAIFDGHAGHDAAAYSSAHLHQYLVESKYFNSNPEQALKDAFCKTDALFIEKCEVENISSGTTAVCALLKPKEKQLYIAWAGDSQAALVKQGKVLQCVNPHKPDRQDERERVEKQGGCVLLWGTWRVNGQLAVSRAIGDPSYKPYVSAIPDVIEYALDGNEDFLILGCDGLWDHVTECMAATTVYNLLRENKEDTDRVSKSLVQQAKQEGSADNITVIVVFLKDPARIVAEAHNRAHLHNGSKVTMDASLDNANNPFSNSNGTPADNVLKNDDLLLHLTGSFTKQNGTEGDFFNLENSNNGRKPFDDGDFGPETDVDAVDEGVMSPHFEAGDFAKINNNPDEFKKILEQQHQMNALEFAHELQKQQTSEFDEATSPREETPTPPVDAVHDVSGLADSDSEDEWDYIKGEEANKAPNSLKLSLQLDNQVEEPLDDMSQLNPNAAEFVPVSPTRSIPSPACKNLINDEIISQSPRRLPQREMDMSVPTPLDFECEIKSRPSEVYSNGHDSNGHDKENNEDLLNGKNIEEIPEFQPGSTPTKNSPDEFHFGPNAAPFTPAKLLDQSEALSTQANFGDESVVTLGASFNESVDVNFLMNKENSDPMSMSFYDGKEGDNPFDLNKVQLLPENVEEFLNDDKENKDPTNVLIDNVDFLNGATELNNDERMQTTDLDKVDKIVDDEKELASPMEDDFSGDFCQLPKTPEPSRENLLNDVVEEPTKPSEVEEVNTFLNNTLQESKSPAKEELPESNLCDMPESNICMAPQMNFAEAEPLLDIAAEPIQEQPVTPEPFSESGVASPEPFIAICPPGPISPEPELSQESGVESPRPQDLNFLEDSITPEPQPLSPEVQVLSPEVQDSDISVSSPVEEEKHDICKLEAEKVVESPEEDVTSSVKDDVSSPLSPQETQIVEQQPQVEIPIPEKEEFQITEQQLEIIETPQGEVHFTEQQPEIMETQAESQEEAQITKQPQMETPSEPLKVEEQLASPLTQEEVQEQIVNNLVDDLAPQVVEPAALPVIEGAIVKTDSIVPEFAEPAVVTTPEEPSVIEEVAEIAAAATAVAAVAAAGATLVPEAAAETSTKTPSPSAGKKAAAAPKTRTSVGSAIKKTPTTKPQPAKASSASKLGAAKAPATPTSATRLSLTKASPKPGAKPLAAKTTTTAASKPAPKPAAASRTLMAPKPKPTTTAAPISKKPLTNGDARPKTAPAPRPGAAKPAAPSAAAKPAATRPPPITRPSTAPKAATAAAKPASSITATKTTTSSTLLNRNPATKTATTTRTTATKQASSTSSKSAAAPAPKPRTTLSSVTASKPRVPLTKTVTKAGADTEKQIKESANKLTASRVSSARAAAGAGPAATKSTVRKTEVGKNLTKTITSAAATSSKTLVGKKPLEITRNVTKTKTTKVEKPKENGISSTVVTEEITAVNNLINCSPTEVMGEMEIMGVQKDNSPIDNKLIVENNLIEATNAD